MPDEPLDVAARALRHRDLPAAAVEARLERAGVEAPDRERTLETLRRVGWVDDDRFAAGRARTLAERGWGDEAIEADLERQGVGEEERSAALAALEPERVRAAAVVARRGRGPRTAGYLARRGFCDEAVEAAAVVADDA